VARARDGRGLALGEGPRISVGDFEDGTPAQPDPGPAGSGEAPKILKDG